MSAFVVEVNVAIVANGKCDQANAACVRACQEIIMQVRCGGVIVLDDRMRILDEYMRNLSMRGQPGLGDAFMKWVWEHQADPSVCEKVALTLRSNDPEDFAQFPQDSALAKFDPSDKRYVAAALASHNNPELLNAVDSDYWDFREPLEKYGVKVRFLCRDCLRKLPADGRKKRPRFRS